MTIPKVQPAAPNPAADCQCETPDLAPTEINAPANSCPHGSISSLTTGNVFLTSSGMDCGLPVFAFTKTQSVSARAITARSFVRTNLYFRVDRTRWKFAGHVSTVTLSPTNNGLR